MKRITPKDSYKMLPCSVVALGTALGLTDEDSVNSLCSDFYQNVQFGEGGYLSLREMNRIIRQKLRVSKSEKYKRGERPKLRDFAHTHPGFTAIVCVMGHYLYFDGRDYHSFLWNGSDPVVAVWYIKK